MAAISQETEAPNQKPSVAQEPAGNSGYTVGQSWAALRGNWKAYKVAKVKAAQGNEEEKKKMFEYANRIRKVQGELGKPLSTFPELGIN